jgi:hypothetical protein
MGKRVSYFDRQLLRAEDFRLEQGYHIARRRGTSAGMFRPGVAIGLDVVRVDATSVRVTAGLAVDGRGREIVLDGDSGAFPVDPAVTVEIWIAYAEAPSEPVSYLEADEQRFARTDEAPAIVPVPPGSVPADGIRLAVVPAGGEPDMSGRPVAGPRDGSVTAVSLADAAVTEHALADDAVSSRALGEADGGASGQDTASGSGVKTGHLQDGAVTADKLAAGVADGLFERTVAKLLETGVPIGDRSVTPDLLADDAVSSRALAEAAPGSTDQDTGSGTGVKTGHLADRAVTGPKLADGAVSFAKLATRLVFDRTVRLPPAPSADRPGVQQVFFDSVPVGERAFYLVSVHFLDPADLTVRWTRITVEDEDGTQFNGLLIEHFHQQTTVTVRCVAVRLA